MDFASAPHSGIYHDPRHHVGMHIGARIAALRAACRVLHVHPDTIARALAVRPAPPAAPVPRHTKTRDDSAKASQGFYTTQSGDLTG